MFQWLVFNCRLEYIDRHVLSYGPLNLTKNNVLADHKMDPEYDPALDGGFPCIDRIKYKNECNECTI